MMTAQTIVPEVSLAIKAPGEFPPLAKLPSFMDPIGKSDPRLVEVTLQGLVVNVSRPGDYRCDCCGAELIPGSLMLAKHCTFEIAPKTFSPWITYSCLDCFRARPRWTAWFMSSLLRGVLVRISKSVSTEASVVPQLDPIIDYIGAVLK